MGRDVSVTVSPDKVYVLTAHWAADVPAFERFKGRRQKFGRKWIYRRPRVVGMGS